MDQFERVAIFTMIEGIESQLKGLKNLIATSANAHNTGTTKHQTTRIIGDPSEEGYLSEEEEERFAKDMEAKRLEETQRIQLEGEKQFQEQWKKTQVRMNGYETPKEQ